MAKTATNTTSTSEAAVETATKAKKTSKKEEASKERYAYFLKVKCTFTSELLGTNPSEKDIYRDYLAKDVTKEQADEETEHLSELDIDEKGLTVFCRNPEDPSIAQIKDYTWKGFFKERASGLNGVPGTCATGMKAFIKEIDKRISVYPRFIDLELPAGQAISVLERPLRANGPTGPRTALARSEVAPIGTTCEVTFRTETKDGMRLILECLREGAQYGTGQWRNAGYGRFTFEVIDNWAELINPVSADDFDFPVR